MGELKLRKLDSWDPDTQSWGDVFVDAGLGIVVFRAIAVEWIADVLGNDELHANVIAHATYDDDARAYQIWDVTISGQSAPVTTDVLVHIPLVRWLRQFAQDVVAHWGGPVTEWPNSELSRPIDERGWRKIAAVHRLHDAVGNRATMELADHFGVSRSAASKWIRIIKEEGLNEPIEVEWVDGLPQYENMP